MTGLGVKVCPMCAWAMPAQGAGPSVYLGAFHPTAGGLTIFLSYGHDGLTDVSRHLTRVLKKRGHSVWFDETSLTSGCDWAREMAAGLSNARAAGPRGRVIAMLAQHGFRRKDGMAQGYCHREVAEACQTMPQYLLPIMLEDMEPPACLRSMQAHFFDMRGVLTARASPPYPKSSPPWGGGGLTPEEWQAFLTRDPGMITAVNSIVSMLETGHFGPPLVPESLWCEMAAGTGAAAAGAGAAAAAEAAELEGAKEKPRIFISCDSKAAAVGQYIATYLHGADYEVAFDAEVASWGDERGQAFREVRRAYLKSAIFWTAGKTNSWGAYKARRDELLGAASAEARGGGGDPTPTGVSGSPLAADDADDTGAAVRQGSIKACEAPVTKPGKCLFIMTRDSVLRSEAPGSNKSGQCKDEFDLAFSKGISFIPLKAEECTAPLSIVGLQYLSLSRAVERDAAGALVVKEEAFAAVLPQILKGLTGSLASEGEQLVKSNRIRRGLQPCDYKAYLEQCLGRMFFPPPSCVSRAEEWLAAASARAKSVVAGSTSSASILRGASVMVVQGPVGTGKTAFVRHLADEWGAVRAQHIAAEGDDAKLSALRAISSIAYQLTRAFPSLTEMLLKDSFLEKRLPTLTARRWFKDLFIEKLQQAVVWEPLGEGKEPPLVIVMVDGVDLMVDADSEDKVNTFLECLMQFAEDMPANVAFLLTCRSTSYCDPHFGTLESLLARLHTKGAATSMLPMMDPAGASEREDCIRKYLRDALPKAVPPPAPMDGGGLALGSHGTPTPDPLSRQEQGSSLTRERRQSSVLAELGVGASSMFEADGPWASQVAKATDCIVQRSEGVFLYAVQIIRDLKSGTNLSLSRPEDFPWGLQNMHRVLLKQAFKPEDKLSETLSGKVLAVLGATREPMKLQQLAKILGTKLSDVDHAVSKLQPLLRYRDDGVVPAHGRVLPWFESPEAGRFKTFPAHGHTWIIQWCLTAIRSEESMKSMSVPTSYAVRHLEAHCGLAHDETVVAEARQLMKSKEFLQKYRTQLVGDQGMSAFYHDFPPKAGRERSEAILRGKPEGSFLMRNTSDDQLCISLQVNQNARLYTQHLKILPTVLPADSQELLRVFSQLRSKFDMLISQGWPPRATEGPLATEMAELLQHAAQETMYCTQPLLGILDEHRRLGLATVDEAFLSQFVFPNAVSLVQHYMEMGTLLWPVAPQAQVPQVDGGYTTASTMAEFRQEKLHLEGQIESLRDQVEMRESDLDQAFATLQQADAELLRLASEAGERAGGAGGAADDEAIQQLEKDLEAARWKADNLERQLDSAHFELTRLRGEEMASPTAADSAAPSRSDLERMAHTLTLAELREHYVRLQLEVAGSRSTFAEKDAEIKDRTEALVKAKTELAQLRTEVGSVEAVIEENEQLRAMLLDTKAAAEEAARRRQSAATPPKGKVSRRGSGAGLAGSSASISAEKGVSSNPLAWFSSFLGGGADSDPPRTRRPTVFGGAGADGSESLEAEPRRRSTVRASPRPTPPPSPGPEDEGWSGEGAAPPMAPLPATAVPGTISSPAHTEGMPGAEHSKPDAGEFSDSASDS